MAGVHADEALAAEVAGDAPRRQQVFELPEGDPAGQPFCPLQADIARGQGRPDRAEALERAAAEPRAALDRGEAFRMTSARIPAVVLDD